jgi:hypothetical protein
MTPRRMNFDLALDDPTNPVAGDILHSTSRVRQQHSWYVIVEARPVDSRVWGNRWALTLRRLAGSPKAHEVNVGARVWYSTPYARGERPGVPAIGGVS